MQTTENKSHRLRCTLFPVMSSVIMQSVTKSRTDRRTDKISVPPFAQKVKLKPNMTFIRVATLKCIVKDRQRSRIHRINSGLTVG